VLSKKFDSALRRCPHLASFAEVSAVQKKQVAAAAATAPADAAVADAAARASGRSSRKRKSVDALRTSGRKKVRPGEETAEGAAAGAAGGESGASASAAASAAAARATSEANAARSESALPPLHAAVYALGTSDYYKLSIGTKVSVCFVHFFCLHPLFFSLLTFSFSSFNPKLVLMRWLCDSVVGTESVRVLLAEREAKRSQVLKDFKRVATEQHKIIAQASAEAEVRRALHVMRAKSQSLSPVLYPALAGASEAARAAARRSARTSRAHLPRSPPALTSRARSPFSSFFVSFRRPSLVLEDRGHPQGDDEKVARRDSQRAREGDPHVGRPLQQVAARRRHPRSA
jgi:hypothetical protein